MSSSVRVAFGPKALGELLASRTFDLRGLDVDGFRRWLECHLPCWRRDPVFAQQERIRELRRACPELRALEEEHRRTRAADEASPPFRRLRQIDRELLGAERAVAGLAAALENAVPEDRPALQQKLQGFQDRRQALLAEQGELVLSSPVRQTLLGIEAELAGLRAGTGLDREEALLAELKTSKGRRAGRSGQWFELQALDVTRAHVLPDLIDRHAGPEVGGRLRVLRGVKLGTARTELDEVIVRQPQAGDQPVDVLAVVEVKRNVNDVGHGFRQRQEDLAWFTGDSGRYDPETYRTWVFPKGHFDREAVHEQEGEVFRFGPGSFGRFHREPGTGRFLAGLYFVTRPGDVWGVSAAALARIRSRVASDPQWQPDAEAYLRRLLVWCQSLAEAVETPDVLRLYADAAGHAHQVLIVGG